MSEQEKLQRQQEMLEAAKRVWKREQEQMKRRREMAKRFGRRTGTEGGSEKMEKDNEEPTRNQELAETTSKQTS
jgi:hypothetical protein